MQDFDWSRERSAKVIYLYTSDESDIHMKTKLDKPFFQVLP